MYGRKLTEYGSVDNRMFSRDGNSKPIHMADLVPMQLSKFSELYYNLTAIERKTIVNILKTKIFSFDQMMQIIAHYNSTVISESNIGIMVKDKTGLTVIKGEGHMQDAYVVENFPKEVVESLTDQVNRYPALLEQHTRAEMAYAAKNATLK